MSAVFSELTIHAFLFLINVFTESTEVSHVGNIFEDSSGYDKNAFFFDILGAIKGVFQRIFGGLISW